MRQGRLRRAGSPWRILVHRAGGDRAAFDVTGDAADTTAHTVLPGTEFDELVVGRWIHLEQMDTGVWWCNFAGVTVNVSVDRDGRPKRVDVFGPGDWAEPEKGCAYSVTWSEGGRTEPLAPVAPA